MADSSLSVSDRESFLAEPHVAALSVSAGAERGPFTVPIWYQYAPGGEAWVLTEAGSRKARLVETAGRFSLMADRVMPTVRYVSVEGPVTRIVPGTDELLREITARYLPPDQVQAYLDFAQGRAGPAGRDLSASGALADGRSRAGGRAAIGGLTTSQPQLPATPGGSPRLHPMITALTASRMSHSCQPLPVRM